MTAQGAAASFQDTQDPNPKAHEDDTAGHALLANLRHELRTMLNAILGFSEILLDDMKEEDEPDPACHLQCVNQTGKQILAVINDVLDHSKVEPNLSRLDFQKIWTTLYGLLREPLNVLLFHGEILVESGRKEGRQSLIDDLPIIYSSAKQLKAIVEHLLRPQAP